MPRPFPEEKRRMWQEKVQTQRTSGLSMARWCREQQVNYNSLIYWNKRFSEKSQITRDSFQELHETKTDPGVAIECQGMKIVLLKSFDSAVLAQCLQVLKALSC